ncbi:MAG: hypothetical protein M0Z27_04200 [Thermaerobacter sp.]|nr:hypothetical protein [Thermaerobacter sp.]
MGSGKKAPAGASGGAGAMIAPSVGAAQNGGGQGGPPPGDSGGAAGGWERALVLMVAERLKAGWYGQDWEGFQKFEVDAAALMKIVGFHPKDPAAGKALAELRGQVASHLAGMPQDVLHGIALLKGFPHPTVMGQSDPEKPTGSLAYWLNPLYGPSPSKKRIEAASAARWLDLGQEERAELEALEATLAAAAAGGGSQMPQVDTAPLRPAAPAPAQPAPPAGAGAPGMRSASGEALIRQAKAMVAAGKVNPALGQSQFSGKVKELSELLAAAATRWAGVPPRVGKEEFKARRFKYEKDASELGGGHEKHFYLDQDGVRWLFKPDKHGAGAVAAAEAAASEIAYRVGQPSVGVHVFEDSGEKRGSMQPMLRGAVKLGSDPTTYNQAQVRHLVREHVIAWATSEHDCNHKNFIVTPQGQVVGVDKAQAFKFFGADRLALDYHPNQSNDPPVHVRLYQAVKTGKVKVNPYDALPVIEAFEGIPDAEYREILRPVAEMGALAKVPWYPRVAKSAAARLGKKSVSTAQVAEEFLRLACERKQNLRADFEAFFRGIFGAEFSFGG